MQDNAAGKQGCGAREELWNMNNQNYLLPDLLQQSQISPNQMKTSAQELQNNAPANQVKALKPVTNVKLKSLDFFFPQMGNGELLILVTTTS